MTTDVAIWLTKSAFDKLSVELEEMKGPRMAEIVAEISAARDEGDLKENGGYHAARDAQARLNGEIEQLQAVLQRADTAEPADDGLVEAGKVVTYKFDGDGDDEAEAFLLASIEMKPFYDGDVYSPAAPIGQALMGHKAGETVEFTGPTGRTMKVQVLSAVPFSG
ncbi:MAG: transcription elongation factor GreA [Nocardioides sp.]